MNIREYIRELDVISQEMSDIVLNSNYCQVGSTVSWGDYRTGIPSGVNYLSHYRRVVDERQYSFLLAGGHAIQFYCEWDGGRIASGKQAIYPAPYVINGWEDEWPDFELTEEELLSDPDPESDSVDKTIRATCWSHIRFDYDSKVESHDVSHLQHSAMNDFRVPCSKILPPFTFMMMAIQLLHRDYHRSIREKGWFIEAAARSKRQCIPVPLVDPSYPFISMDVQ